MKERIWGKFRTLPDPSTLIFCKLVAFSMPLAAATDVGICILVPGIVIVPVCFCCCAVACWFCCCDAVCWFVCWPFVCWFCCWDAVCWFVCCVVACWVCGCALTCCVCWFNVLANGIVMFVPGIVNVACPNAAHEICPKYIHFVFLLGGGGEEWERIWKIALVIAQPDLNPDFRMIGIQWCWWTQINRRTLNRKLN